MRNLEKEQRLGRNEIENLCIKPQYNYCTGEEQFTFFKLPKCVMEDTCFFGAVSRGKAVICNLFGPSIFVYNK